MGLKSLRPPTESPVLDKVRSRIQALRAKTVENGCTQDEALAAAAKVAELLDRHALELSDIEWNAAVCETRPYGLHRKKRIPLADCIGAIAHFCDCKVWREKEASGEARFVFFGLPADAEAALSLAGMVEEAVRTELGRYKTSPAYGRLRHQDRHLANGSFALGMVSSIAARLEALKAERDGGALRGGRDIVLRKTSVLDRELERLGLRFTTAGRSAARMVAPDAYAAGGAAASAVAVPPRG